MGSLAARRATSTASAFELGTQASPAGFVPAKKGFAVSYTLALVKAACSRYATARFGILTLSWITRAEVRRPCRDTGWRSHRCALK